MVGAIKRWLGIDVLERENAARADEIMTLTNRINSMVVAPQIQVAPKPKIEPRPHRANWRTFRAAMERDAEIEQQP